MLNNPKNGWSTFTIKDFTGTPSYLTNAARDLLLAFYHYYKYGSGTAAFDEEGSEFILILSDDACYVIEEKDELILHDFSDFSVLDLAKEAVSDISSCIDEWALFGACCLSKAEQKESLDSVVECKEEIICLLDTVKKYISQKENTKEEAY